MSLVSGPIISVKRRFERCDHGARVVDAEGRLRHIGERDVVGDVELGDILLALDEIDGSGDLAAGALDLRVAVMADKDEGSPLGDVAFALAVHFGNQRARGIENREVALDCFAFDGLGHAMRTENRARTGWNFGKVLDELRPHFLQALDDIAIVDDFVAHIDGRAVFGQSALDDLDGADHAGAKSARLSQDDLHISVLVINSTGDPERKINRSPPARSTGNMPPQASAGSLATCKPSSKPLIPDQEFTSRPGRLSHGLRLVFVGPESRLPPPAGRRV